MNNNQPDQVVCFDLFNTLVSTGAGGRQYQEIILEICRKQGVPEEIIKPRIYPFVRDRLMTRQSSYLSMVSRILETVRVEVDQKQKEEIARAWAAENERAEWIGDAENILQKMREDTRRRLVLVSNITSSAWEEIDRKLRVGKQFDYLSLSCEIGLAKPDPRIWSAIERRYPGAGEFFMIGDNETDDLSVPKKRGWKVGRAGAEIPLEELLAATVPSCRRGTVKGKRESCEQARKYLILDVPVRTEEKEALQNLGADLFDGKDMSKKLVEWPGWEKLDPQKTLLVFPGNGGRLVEDSLPAGWLEKWPNRINIDVKRVWIPGENPQVLGGDIFPRMMFTNITDAIIIDDALSSGITANKILRANRPWLPCAKWSLVVWTAQKKTGAKGFSQVYSCESVGNETTRLPLNSISTLLENPEIAGSYAQRKYGADAEKLLGLLGEMRELRLRGSSGKTFGDAA